MGSTEECEKRDGVATQADPLLLFLLLRAVVVGSGLRLFPKDEMFSLSKWARGGDGEIWTNQGAKL